MIIGEEGVCDSGILTALVDLTAIFVEKHLDVLVSSNLVYTQMRARTSAFIDETFVNLSQGGYVAGCTTARTLIILRTVIHL